MNRGCRWSLRAVAAWSVVALFPGRVLSAGKMAPTPRLAMPYVARNVCPFECCTYRRWAARRSLPAYRAERDTAHVVFTIARGDSFDAIAGDVYVLRPGIARAMQSRPYERDSVLASLPVGARIELLDYGGEGGYRAWVRGRFTGIGEDDWCAPNAKPGEDCWFRLEREPTTEWWVRIRARDGREGWILPDNGPADDESAVDNSDACS